MFKLKFTTVACSFFLLLACSNNTKPVHGEMTKDKNTKPLEQTDTFTPPDASFWQDTELDENDKNYILKQVIPSSLKPLQIKSLKSKDLLTAYQNLYTCVKKYQDSTTLKRQYIKDLFHALDKKYVEIQESEVLDDRLKLELASLSSEIYSTLSNSQQVQ